MGPMTTWTVVTKKLELESQIEQNANTLSSSAEELTAISQQKTSPEMRSRLLALQSVAFLGSTPIGGPSGGVTSRSTSRAPSSISSPP